MAIGAKRIDLQGGWMRTLIRAAWLGIMVLGMGLQTTSGEEPKLSRGVGERVRDFHLKNALTNEDVSLYGFRGKKAGVIVFTGTQCPIGDLYAPRLAELARKYEHKDVVFLAINANDSESAEAVAAHARKFGITFPVLKDPGRTVADALQARRTCEVLVVDGSAVLRYRGAIDDQYGLGTRREEAKRNFLVDALDAVLAGKDVENPGTSVLGCPIEGLPVESLANQLSTLERVRPPSEEQAKLRDEAEGALPDVGAVTYSEHVAGVIQNRCQNCHRPGQVAPFSLLTYKDAKRWASSIAEVVEDRRMPPWHADPRYGHFSNDRRLSARERSILLSWVKQGAPEGDPAKAPPERSFSAGWAIGEPDIVFQMPKPYTVKPEGFLNYQRFYVQTKFKEDIWVTAAEARPDDRSVVHHIIVYLYPDPSDPQYRVHLCGYAPGDMPSVFPPGVGKRIPAGSTLEFEVHYTPVGRVKVDQSSVGLKLAKGPITREVFTIPIGNQKLSIPPGDPNHEVRASRTFKDGTILLSFMPHMHLRGKDFKYTAVYPDGREEILLSVPAYDFGWQSYYTLAEPLKLPPGTRIDCVAHYDNSADNPANPDPTKTVRWGDQTYEEMMIGYMDVIVDRAVESAAPRSTGAKRGAAGNAQRVLRAVERRTAPATTAKP